MVETKVEEEEMAKTEVGEIMGPAATDPKELYEAIGRVSGLAG